ncbi:MAG: PPC domain-containing protein [Deltaproteobacteria bacterium]|jgi:hypothetical protein|nr:PPC domain-containing protein [Deltaproteobacteria bacterium]
MSIRIFMSLLALCAALALVPEPAAEAQKPAADPAKPSRSANSEAAERLTLAAQLAEEGRRTGSAVELAAAAELLASTSVKDRDMAKTEVGAPGDQAAPAEGGPEPPLSGTAADLFAEAAALARAASNEPLAAQIELSANAAGSRQPSPGDGGRHRDTVRPGTTDIYSVRYNANELARATVIAGGDFDLDIYVYDPSGTLVAYDNDSTSIGICVWIPPQTGEYKLGVKNTTSSQVNYLIFTN